MYDDFLISEELFFKVLDLYKLWKELNLGFKSISKYQFKGSIVEKSGRGVNMHETISEVVCCYVNDFSYLTIGSEDAVDPKNNKLIQVKATSNWSKDLTSFGPTSEFDELHFLRLKEDMNDYFYLYRIPIDNLHNIKMNKNETFKEQQQRGVRPRFSIIKNYINKYNIKPYAKVNLNTGEIFK